MCHRTLRHQSPRPPLVAGRASLSRNHHGPHGQCRSNQRALQVQRKDLTEHEGARQVWHPEPVPFAPLQSAQVYVQERAGPMTARLPAGIE
jgi:hypothetical protein